MATKFMNFETKMPVAGSSKLKATRAGHIYNMLAEKDLTNGMVISKGAHVDGKLEAYAVAAPSAEFKGEIIGVASNGNYYVEVTGVGAGDLLVLQTPVIYETFTSQCQHESNFYIPKGELARSYELYLGDIFELSAEGFTEAVAEGDAVAADSGTYKLKKYVAA